MAQDPIQLICPFPAGILRAYRSYVLQLIVAIAQTPEAGNILGPYLKEFESVDQLLWDHAATQCKQCPGMSNAELESEISTIFSGISVPLENLSCLSELVN
jgi:hypothetical protein